MDQQLRTLEQQFLVEPSIQRLHAYLHACQRAGQPPSRFTLSSLFRPIIQSIVDQIPFGFRFYGEKLRTEILVTDSDYLYLFLPGASPHLGPRDIPHVLQEREFDFVGPIFDICLRDSGGVPVGSCFIRLIIDATHHRYLLLNPPCNYLIVQEIIDYLNVRIIDEFSRVGWHHYGQSDHFFTNY